MVPQKGYKKLEKKLETMNRNNAWDLKAKDVNLKDVKSRSLGSE